jgi:hypothetical protein
MKKVQTLKLIDGEFSAQDAKEVLMSLYSSKLNFHQMKNFGSNERFGKNDETATKRIPELKESMTVISAIIQEAANTKKNLLVTASVNIEFASVKK